MSKNTVDFTNCPLQASSAARQKNLLSLRDYMQRCTNELYWMDQQADERITYDWSDNNLDYPARKRQYEVRLRSHLMIGISSLDGTKTFEYAFMIQTSYFIDKLLINIF